MDLSVIIVSYNSAGLLPACLRSIESCLAGLAYEVCVVDNASTDQSGAIVRRMFPKFKLVRHARNRGFAAGVNSGLRCTSGRQVLWLNPDSELLNTGIRDVMKFLDDNPTIGIVGPQIVNPDKSIQFSCRSFPSYTTALFNRYSWLTRLRPENRLTQKYLYNGWDHASPRQVDWVSGACLLHRRSVSDRLGGVDERYFLYGEDVDFCRMTQLAGWDVFYHPAFRVMHHIAGSSRKSARRAIVERHRSMWRYYSKHFSRNLFKDAVVGSGIAARCLWMVVSRDNGGNGH